MLERTRLRQGTSSGALIDTVGWETSNRAQKDLVEVGHEQLRSNGHGWVGDQRSGSGGHGASGTRAVALELTWLGGRQAAGLERAWWRQETSGCARMDTGTGD